MFDITHTVVKNDKKEVTGYALSAEGVNLGSVAKTDEGFAFTPDAATGMKPTTAKTMKALKLDVGKSVPKDFVNAGKATATKAAKAAKSDATVAKGGPEATEGMGLTDTNRGKPAPEDVDLS